MADYTGMPGYSMGDQAQPNDGINLTAEGRAERERQRVLYLEEKVAKTERERQEWYDRAIGWKSRLDQQSQGMAHLKEKVEQAQQINAEHFSTILTLRTTNSTMHQKTSVEISQLKEERDNLRLETNDKQRQIGRAHV